MAKKIYLYLIILSITVVPICIQAWSRTYGLGNEAGRCGQETFDKGYIATGYTYSFSNGEFDVWLVKTDSTGDSLWSRNFGGVKGDEGKCVRQTNDGGYIVTGVTGLYREEKFDLDLLLIKTDSIGDTAWSRTYGGEKWDFGWWVEQTADGGYVVIGENYTFNALWLLKLDSLGDTLWTRTYSGSGRGTGYCVQQTADSGYIATGKLGHMLWLLRFDPEGDTIWTKQYGLNINDIGYSVRQTSEGGFIVAGLYSPSSSNSRLWLLKTDSLGDTLWSRQFGGEGFDGGYSVDETSDGGFIVTGEINLDLCLIKTNVTGDTEWIREFGDTLGDRGSSVQVTSDGGFIITGVKDYVPFTSMGYLWLLKTDSLGYVEIQEDRIYNPSSFDLLSPIGSEIVLRYADYPDGFHANVFDVTGRKVDELHLTQTQGTITWGKGQNPGVYFIKPVTGNAPSTKVILTR